MQVSYGKITFEMQAPSVAGSVTAAILICAYVINAWS